MALKPHLVDAASFPSAARAALAEAIAARDAIIAEIAAIEAQDEPARSRWSDARVAYEAAKKTVDGAKAAYATHLVDMATGRGGEEPVSPQMARQRLADAEDDLETAKTVHATIRSRRDQKATELRYARERAKAAAIAVMREFPAVAKVAEDFERLQRELLDRGLVMKWLVQEGVIKLTKLNDILTGGVDASYRPKVAYTPTDLAVQRFESPPLTWKALMQDERVRGAVRWEAALRSLLTDADATVGLDAA
jgi:hypothetical protein